MAHPPRRTATQKCQSKGELIRNLALQTCLTVAGADQHNGAPVVAAACDGSVSQHWYHENRQVRSRLNGKGPQVTGGAYAVGAKASVWDCDAAPAKNGGGPIRATTTGPI
ncbi:ricin-type beta-trefoil lectin domain protein [Amycolatopsis sp. NPDC051071]|uniref:RICIN domain-containing protein n=1 Tax=Amycolatopsis sp. NPDC051071 TaxID=3154637 RepID=UPI00342362C5